MSNEERIKALFCATSEQLAAVDRALAGQSAPEERAASLRLFRMGQAAERTGLSRCTLWRMIQDGRLPAVEIRKGSHRIPEAALLALVEGAGR